MKQAVQPKGCAAVFVKARPATNGFVMGKMTDFACHRPGCRFAVSKLAKNLYKKNQSVSVKYVAKVKRIV